jgi:Na+/melibiose symporter-like transporter
MAVFFIGAYVNPVRNVWVLQAGLVACALVVPLALVCGSIRQIPLGWRLIDCSFGVVGAAPLWFCLRWVRELERSGYPHRHREKNAVAP